LKFKEKGMKEVRVRKEESWQFRIWFWDHPVPKIVTAMGAVRGVKDAWSHLEFLSILV
jgi:hypothetical protein